jgi:hypothetical protein
MSFFGTTQLFCTVCGCRYQWSPNHGFSKSRACCRECHEEFQRRETLAIMGKAYYPRPSEAEEKK